MGPNTYYGYIDALDVDTDGDGEYDLTAYPAATLILAADPLRFLWTPVLLWTMLSTPYILGLTCIMINWVPTLLQAIRI